MPADPIAVAAFKKAPLQFMKQNLVRAPSTQTQVYGRPMALTLKSTQSTADCNGVAVPVFAVGKAESGDPSFESFICDYSAGNVSYQVLSGEADFCFTFAMDGCTFSVGSATVSGDVLVSHGNAKGVTEAGSNQVERQRNLANQMHNGNIATALEPGTYRPAGERVATTFGVRDSDGWHFYYASYQVTKKSYPPGYAHYGVCAFDGTPV